MMNREELEEIRDEASRLESEVVLPMLKLLNRGGKPKNITSVPAADIRKIMHVALSVSGRLNAIIIQQDDHYRKMEEGRDTSKNLPYKTITGVKLGEKHKEYHTHMEAEKEAKKIERGVVIYNTETQKYYVGRRPER